MKKLKKWWAKTGIDMTVTLLTLALVLCSCLFGYILGSTDGYAEGYVSCLTGQYEQNPEHNFIKNIIFSTKALKISVEYYLHNINPEPPKTVVPEMTIQYINDAPDVTQELSEGLTYIPTNILHQFNNDGWEIIVQPSIDTMEYKGTEFVAAGYTDSTSKVICLEANAKIVSHVTIHEFGHYFDFLNNHISDSSKWNQLYTAEWKGLYIINRNFHDVDTTAEYFAEIFKLCLIKPDLIKELCPESYKAMNDLIQNYT